MAVRQAMFRYRGYTPLPFLIVMLVFGRPSAWTLVPGFALVAAGGWFRLWGVAIAGSETRTTVTVGATHLVTTGPFAYVRNPLYAGNILIYCGVAVMANGLTPWLLLGVLLFFVVQYRLIVSLEEEHLRRQFGGEFERYRAAVPRFVPTLRRYPRQTTPQPRLDWSRGWVSERRTRQAILLVAALLILLSQIRT
jgi:protein-S-isoprenylcysteine O-methyltransferase Ste14